MNVHVRRRTPRGAAAVEFALVMPILFLVMFGILQYGLWFNDSLNTRQGVREGARLGVVADFASEGTCTTTVKLDLLACKTASRIDALTGTSYVKVKSPSPWAKGSPLTVCALVETNTPGILPMPSDGWIFSKTLMSIEKADVSPLPTGTGTFGGGLPAGAPSWPADCN